MRVPLIFSVVLLAIGIAACRGSQPSPPSESGPQNDILNPTNVTAPTMPATHMVRALPRPHAPNPPKTAGTLGALAGTTWRAGEYTFAFERGGHLIVRGGNYEKLSDAGVPGKASNRRGVLSLDILGRTTYGTWDGSTLTIEGVEAQRIDAEMAKSTAPLE